MRTSAEEFRTLPQIAIGAVFASLATTAEVVFYYKADNTISLTNLASWWLDATGTTPAVDAPVNTTTPSAVCIWNNMVTTANTMVETRIPTISCCLPWPSGPVRSSPPAPQQLALIRVDSPTSSQAAAASPTSLMV